MNLFQKFCALFGAEYVVIFVKNIWVWEGRTKVSVRRVKKLAAGVWVIARCQTLLNLGGGVGDRCIEWKPLTKGVEKFYLSGGDVRCKALTPTAITLGVNHERD